MDFRCQTAPAPTGFFVGSPFLAPLACWWTLTAVLSSISVVSSTRSCSIWAERIRSHTLAFVHAAIYTLPWSEALRQIPPGNSSIQPIQDCVEHLTVAFSWPPSLRFLFGRKQELNSIPLFFTYFMSFHELYFTSLASFTQYWGFKTDSNLFPSIFVFCYLFLIHWPKINFIQMDVINRDVK